MIASKARSSWSGYSYPPIPSVTSGFNSHVNVGKIVLLVENLNEGIAITTNIKTAGITVQATSRENYELFGKEFCFF